MPFSINKLNYLIPHKIKTMLIEWFRNHYPQRILDFPNHNIIIIKYTKYANDYSFAKLNQLLDIIPIDKLFQYGIKSIVTIKYTSTRTGYIDEIKFGVRSNKEYSWRAKLSYTEEKTTMYWIDNIIKQNDVVFDIGANVGAYSLLIGKRIKDSSGSGNVYAIEPESQNFESLNYNIRINNLAKQILAIPLAVTNKLKFDSFYLSSNIPGSATHGFGKPESEGVEFDPTHVQGMLGISLDEFVRFSSVRFPNHIKIDVDGLEMKIVKNMRDILSDHRLKSIIVEVKDSLSNGEIESIILNHNFEIVFEEKVGEHDGIIKNVLFSRPNSEN